MQRINLLFATMLFTFFSNAQQFEAKSSPQISIEKGSVYMNLLLATENEMYSLKVQNMVKKVDADYSICKYTRNMSITYEKNLSKYVGDRFFEGVFAAKGRLYLFTADFQDKNRKYSVFGIEIDKNTGDFIGAEKVLVSYDRPSKFDKHYIKIAPDSDSSRFIILANKDNSADDFYCTTVVDLDLKTLFTSNANFNLSNTQIFKLENAIVEKNNTVILAGKQYDVIRGAKNTVWKYAGYHIYRFDEKGKKINDYVLNLIDKYTIQCKLFKIMPANDLILAGTFTDDETKAEAKGVFVTKLDNTSLITTKISIKEFTNDEKFNRDLDMSYPGINNFYFFKFIYNSDKKKLYLIAETYNVGVAAEVFRYDRVTYGGDEGISRKNLATKTVETYTYHCGDILVLDISLGNSSIDKYYLISKRQVEKIAQNEDNNYPGILNATSNEQPSNYIFGSTVAPFYASIAFHCSNDKLYVIYNEQEKNAENAKAKDYYPGFYTSYLTAISINLQDGKMNTKKIKQNESQLAFMPRYIVAKGNDFYIPALNITHKLKSDFKLTRFTITD